MCAVDGWCVVGQKGTGTRVLMRTASVGKENGERKTGDHDRMRQMAAGVGSGGGGGEMRGGNGVWIGKPRDATGRSSFPPQTPRAHWHKVGSLPRQRVAPCLPCPRQRPCTGPHLSHPTTTTSSPNHQI